MSDTEEKKEEKAAPKKGSKKLIIIIAAVVVLLLGGGGAFLMLGSKAPSDEDQHEEEAQDEGIHLATLKLEPFIVNLSDNASFLKVTLLLEYNVAAVEAASGEGAEKGGHGAGGGGEKGPAMPAIFSEREPMLRDAVIRVLSSKKAPDVLVPDGKLKLKEDLIEAINEALGMEEPVVVNIYFTEFIIQ